MNFNSIMYDIAMSWVDIGGELVPDQEIFDWIKKRNNDLYVSIKKINLGNSKFWYYDANEGCIRNTADSFFRIAGITYDGSMNDEVIEQPIILQNEIGYLGILCKKINGVMHFLMQAKIEPGNINKIQLSPTIQATRSNFLQLHGGNKPAYLEFFVNADPKNIIVDQIQSEQSSRFWKKRNRNIVVYIEDDIEVSPNHKWMTLRQIKTFMKIDNIVNMDTRTVISCLPFSKCNLSEDQKKVLRDKFSNVSLYESLFGTRENKFPQVFNRLNNYKMFYDCKTELKNLFALKNWEMKNNEFVNKEGYPFKVIFCDIIIEGREVKQWSQPLFEAEGIATFGLFVSNTSGKSEFLVKLKSEIGCFDKIELGPTIQKECTDKVDWAVEKVFFEKLEKNDGVIFDTILSEEGGRFYHEQNRNILIEIDKNEIVVDENYIWLDFYTLNNLIQVNNIVNIQLRNLLSVLEG